MPINPFNLEKEFPNYFQMMLESVDNNQEKCERIKQKIIELLEKNVQATLKRIQLYYVNEKGELSLDDYFGEMVKHIEKQFAQSAGDKYKDNYHLNLYLAGGVIRTLLANIYRNIHQNLYHRIHHKLDRVGEPVTRMPDTLNTPEYWLQQLRMFTQEKTMGANVLGIGSDMDMFYVLELKEGKEPHPCEFDLHKVIKAAGENFLNSARNILDVSTLDETMQNSILPPADVTDYMIQTASAMSQGVSALDWLAFELNPKDGKEPQIKEPPDELKQKYNATESILENFIQGEVEYKPSQKDNHVHPAKSTIRGLRPLLEIPFLNLKSKELINEEIEKIKAAGPLSMPAKKQLDKLIRNSQFSGANNRALRAEADDPLVAFQSALKAIKEPAIPKYQLAKPIANRVLNKDRRHNIENKILSINNFIEKYTDNGILYHGTPKKFLLHIMRGGFHISDATQGKAAYGSGVYTAINKHTALSYADEESSVFHLSVINDPNIRAIAIGDLSKNDLAMLEKEAKEKEFLDVNELLRESYDIDAIIPAGVRCVVVQNTSIFEKVDIVDTIKVLPEIFSLTWIKTEEINGQLFYFIKTNVNKAIEVFKSYLVLTQAADPKIISRFQELIAVLVGSYMQHPNKETLQFLSHNLGIINDKDFMLKYLYKIIQKAQSCRIIKTNLIDYCRKIYNNQDSESLTILLENIVKYAYKFDLIKSIVDIFSVDELITYLKSMNVLKEEIYSFIIKIEDEALKENLLKEKNLYEIKEDINFQDSDGKTKLINIFSTINVEKELLLLQKAEKILSQDPDLTRMDISEETVFSHAIRKEFISDDYIINMFNKGKVNFNELSNCDELILSACQYKRDDLATFLIKSYDHNFYPACIQAIIKLVAEHDLIKMMQHIVKNSEILKPNFRQRINDNTILQIFMTRKNYDMVRSMVNCENALHDFRHRNKKRENIFFLTVKEKQFDIALIILRSGYVLEPSDETLLIDCYQHANLCDEAKKVCYLMLEHGARDVDGKLLQIAWNNANLDDVGFILQHNDYSKCKLNITINDDGFTKQYIEKYREYINSSLLNEILQDVYRKQKYDIFNMALNVHRDDSIEQIKGLLVEACLDNKIDVAKVIIACLKDLDFLVVGSCNGRGEIGRGKVLSSGSIYSGYKKFPLLCFLCKLAKSVPAVAELAVLVIEKGTCITSTDDFNDTALLISIRNNLSSVVNKLLESNNKDLFNYIRKYEGIQETALIAALHASNEEVAIQLIEKGVDLRAQFLSHYDNDNRKDALKIAHDYKLTKVVRTILNQVLNEGVKPYFLNNYVVEIYFKDILQWFDFELMEKFLNACDKEELDKIFRIGSRSICSIIFNRTKKYEFDSIEAGNILRLLLDKEFPADKEILFLAVRLQDAELVQKLAEMNPDEFGFKSKYLPYGRAIIGYGYEDAFTMMESISDEISEDKAKHFILKLIENKYVQLTKLHLSNDFDIYESFFKLFRKYIFEKLKIEDLQQYPNSSYLLAKYEKFHVWFEDQLVSETLRDLKFWINSGIKQSYFCDDLYNYGNKFQEDYLMKNKDFYLMKFKKFHLMKDKNYLLLRGMGQIFTDFNYYKILYRLGSVEHNNLHPAKIVNEFSKTLLQAELNGEKKCDLQRFIFRNMGLLDNDNFINHIQNMVIVANQRYSAVYYSEAYRYGSIDMKDNLLNNLKARKWNQAQLSVIILNVVCHAYDKDFITSFLKFLKLETGEVLVNIFSRLFEQGAITRQQVSYFINQTLDTDPEIDSYFRELLNLQNESVAPLLNSQDSHGMTSLMLICKDEKFNKDALDAILRESPDFNKYDEVGNSALSLAINNPEVSDEVIIELLKNETVEVNSDLCRNHISSLLEPDLQKRDKVVLYLLKQNDFDIHNLLESIDILNFVAQNNLIESLTYLVNNKLDEFDITLKCDGVFSALEVCAYNGFEKSFNILFDAYHKQGLTISRKELNGLLGYAIEHGSEIIVSRILNYENSPNLNAYINERNNVFQAALMRDLTSIANIILDSGIDFDLTHKNAKNEDAFTLAVKRKHYDLALKILECVEECSKEKINLLIKENSDLLLMIYQDVQSNNHNNSEPAEKIFKKMINLGCKDNDGKILATTCSRVNFEDSLLLISKNRYRYEHFKFAIDSIKRTTEKKEEIFEFFIDKIAANEKSIHVGDLLIAAAYDLKLNNIIDDCLTKLELSNTALKDMLIKACIDQNEELAIKFLNKYSSNKMFINTRIPYKGHLAYYDEKQYNCDLVNFACQLGLTNLAIAALERGFEPSGRNELTGETSLMIAVEQQMDDVVDTLLKYNADVGSFSWREGIWDDRFQDTALIKALFSKKQDLAICLIDRGARLDIQYINRYSELSGADSLQLACELNQSKVVHRIMQKVTPELNLLDSLNSKGNFNYIFYLVCKMGDTLLIDSFLDFYKKRYSQNDLPEVSLLSIYGKCKEIDRQHANKVILHLIEKGFQIDDELYNGLIRDLNFEMWIRVAEKSEHVIFKTMNDKINLVKMISASKGRVFTKDLLLSEQNLIQYKKEFLLGLLESGFITTIEIYDSHKKFNPIFLNYLEDVFNHLTREDLKRYPTSASILVRSDMPRYSNIKIDLKSYKGVESADKKTEITYQFKQNCTRDLKNSGASSKEQECIIKNSPKSKKKQLFN